MADRGFKLTVLTEEKAVIDRTVEAIRAPGSEGYLGVLRNHAPLVTALRPGRLTVTLPDEEPRDYAVSGGFLEINHNTATVLADALERPEDVDLERAERSAERARKRLEAREPGLDAARAEASLWRALNRIRLAREHRRD